MDDRLSRYNGIYQEIEELTGTESMRKLYEHFRGRQVTFPLRLYSPRWVRQTVSREYDGTNLRRLAGKYGYSEKTIRRMLKEEK